MFHSMRYLLVSHCIVRGSGNEGHGERHSHLFGLVEDIHGSSQTIFVTYREKPSVEEVRSCLRVGRQPNCCVQP